MEKYLDENKAAYDNVAKRVLSRKIINNLGAHIERNGDGVCR